MDKVKIDKLLQVFALSGIYLDKDEFDSELQLDSIQFISLIIEIEKQFDVSIDEEHFADDTLKSFNDFLNLLYSMEKIKNSTYIEDR